MFQVILIRYIASKLFMTISDVYYLLCLSLIRITAMAVAIAAAMTKEAILVTTNAISRAYTLLLRRKYILLFIRV